MEMDRFYEKIEQKIRACETCFFVQSGFWACFRHRSIKYTEVKDVEQVKTHTHIWLKNMYAWNWAFKVIPNIALRASFLLDMNLHSHLFLETDSSQNWIIKSFLVWNGVFSWLEVKTKRFELKQKSKELLMAEKA